MSPSIANPSGSDRPTTDLFHDHAHLGRLLAELEDGLATYTHSSERPCHEDNLLAAAEALRDDLMRHCDQEDASLFPFLLERVPSLAPEVEHLIRLHDVMCGVLARLASGAGASRDGSSENAKHLAHLLDRFRSAYREHSEREAAILRGLYIHLSQEDRVIAEGLVAGL